MDRKKGQSRQSSCVTTAMIREGRHTALRPAQRYAGRRGRCHAMPEPASRPLAIKQPKDEPAGEPAQQPESEPGHGVRRIAVAALPVAPQPQDWKRATRPNAGKPHQHPRNPQIDSGPAASRPLTLPGCRAQHRIVKRGWPPQVHWLRLGLATRLGSALRRPGAPLAALRYPKAICMPADAAHCRAQIFRTRNKPLAMSACMHFRGGSSAVASATHQACAPACGLAPLWINPVQQGQGAAVACAGRKNSMRL